MKLGHNLHLAYCTNIHRGETWVETFDSLKTHALAVRRRVCADAPYAIGLRLSNRAANELSDASTLLEFQRWLDENGCYVFTINGFPYGTFHGDAVKTRVYVPDWTTSERVAYTNLLFDLLVKLLPADVEGSVSTLPGGFKPLVTAPGDLEAVRKNIWRSVEHIARLSEKSKRKLHLGLEPEPLCLLECTAEVLEFFQQLRGEHPNDPRLNQHLGVNYDTCHLAVEFEQPSEALGALLQHEIRISKIHLSNALTVRPTAEARAALRAYEDQTYLHQVIVQRDDGTRVQYSDLGDALSTEPETETSGEWRIHFHIPLHCPPTQLLGNTADHLVGTLDWLAQNPARCSHLEMETYTWEVLPPELKNRSVVDQLVAEYEWTLARLNERGLAKRPER